MFGANVRNSLKFLEDYDLQIGTKTTLVPKKNRRKPPRLRKSINYNIEFLSRCGLQSLTPDNSKTFPSNVYDKTIDCSYFEQCYDIIDKLGEGSFGTVMKVSPRDEDKLYAIKLANEPFRGENDRSLKLQEVENHRLFSEHPNIVTLHDAWEEDRLLYMLMELCKNNLCYTGVMPEAECWRVLTDITSALDFLHERGMAHFDVKLENILHGFDGFYKLSDFGLTFNWQNPNGKCPLEGDAKYLPPELLTTNTFTEKADIFSLGISVLELAGNLALPSNGEVWKLLREDTFPREQTLHLSDEFLLLITKMMASDYLKRPSTKEILDLPKVKEILSQKEIRKITHSKQVLCDPFYRFVLTCSIFYTLVHLVALKFLMKLRPNQESLNTSSSFDSEISLGYARANRHFCTSTPCLNWPTYGNETSQKSLVNGLSCSPFAEYYVPSSRNASTSDVDSDTVMFYNISPVKLSRDIKKAIRKQRSLDQLLAERMKNRPKVVRKLIFDSDNENERNGNESPNSSKCLDKQLGERKRNHTNAVRKILFKSSNDNENERNGNAPPPKNKRMKKLATKPCLHVEKPLNE